MSYFSCPALQGGGWVGDKKRPLSPGSEVRAEADRRRKKLPEGGAPLAGGGGRKSFAARQDRERPPEHAQFRFRSRGSFSSAFCGSG
ncbi:hypothetical protein CEXT_472721 [Caerostris extrusa]|uniref:Uncharacterized protein n=1 Tax=Caerostris extrusa TaxID=172846 RepID=A0AAV4X7E6_CAEEX|nr:hypothetical protein CEXT_472721 [Caerostris extrusa]